MKRVFNIAAYPFLLLLAAWITGIILQQQAPQFGGIYTFIGCICFTVIACWLHRIATTKYWIAKLRNIALFLAFMLLGICVTYYQNPQTDPKWYGNDLNDITALKIQVNANPVEKEHTILLGTDVTSVLKNGHWMDANGMMKLYIFKRGLKDTLKPGQSILIPNKLSLITASGNPFAFDQAKYNNRNGIFHQCFLNAREMILLKQDKMESSFISNLRHSIQTSIHENVKDSTTKGLIDAMLLNDRLNLDNELVQAYSTTGIIHILAISGTHVLILAGMILATLSLFPNKQIQRFKYLIALLLIWIYIAITGFPPSADRAAVMFSIYAIGMILNKDSNTLNTWAASGFILLCYNPYWLYDVGVQLSFLAVLSILLFYKPILNWWQPRQCFLRKLWEGIAISIAVQILVFPLVIYYFNQFPLLVFLANIPAGIYSTVLMMGSIFIFIFHAVGISCVWIGTILSIMTKGFNAFIVLLSGLSPESFRLLFLDVVDYWLMMLTIVCCCIFAYYKNVKLLLTGATFFVIMILNFIWKDITALHQERIVVYNLNKESQVDVFRSKRVYHLYHTNTQQYKYALKPALLGFHANESNSNIVQQRLFTINHKNILLLDGHIISTNVSFPVDVLVVSKSCAFQPEQWFQAFHPKKIIIDGSLPRYKALQWQRQLLLAGANVHCVNADGAWVYPSL